nr:hypothetical protein [uncultured Oscillibacter sp.]
MSLLFSEVSFHWKAGMNTVLYESGHPDEYDMRELLKNEDRYAGVRSFGLSGLSVEVQHYRFLGGSSRDWLAEREHVALIEAYNAITPDALFTQRDDVEDLDCYKFCM